MNEEAYEQHLCNALIDQFKVQFKEKTGRTVNISIDGMPGFGLRRPALTAILAAVEALIPQEIVFKSLQSRSRKREIVTLKQIFCKIARDFGYTLSTISGYVYPSGDHSDVIYARNRAADLLEVDPQFRDLYTTILNKLYNDTQTVQLPVEKPGNAQPVLSDVMP